MRYFPYHYSPFASDLKKVYKHQISFEKRKPFKPYDQLMGVLPSTSSHAPQESYLRLMKEEDSKITHFYPTDFKLDLNGKKNLLGR
jgi:5'-3' exoribonuclease 2